MLDHEKREPAATADLLRLGMIAARLHNRDAVTRALLAAGAEKRRSASLLMNEYNEEKGGVSAVGTAGYAVLIQEALVQSGADSVDLLPGVPESGFEVGNVAGVRTNCGVTVSLMAWDLNAAFVIADLTADTDQTVRVSSPLASDAAVLDLQAGATQTVTLTLDLLQKQKPAKPAQSPDEPRQSGESTDDATDSELTEAEPETEADPEADPYDAELYDYEFVD